MTFTVITHPQRSPEWFAARLGIATGSRASDILAKIKNGEAAGRRNYRAQLVAERLTGASQEDAYMNDDMQRGIDLEPAARMAYEADSGLVAEETGFLLADDMPAGCSLDGSVDGFHGIVEIKCPRVATHIEYLRAGKLPARYVPQVTHNLLISGAAWCDFVSYCPALPAHLHLFTVRVELDEKALKDYAGELLAFLAEVEAETEELRNYRKAP